MTFRRFPILLTREGCFFISLTFLFGVSAVNTGLNLLYLLFSTALGLVILSGVFASLNLSKLAVERKALDYSFPQREMEVQVVLLNQHRLFPAFFLAFTDELSGPLEKKGEGFFPWVLAGQKGRASYSLVAQHRGKGIFSALRLKSTFPLGLFQNFKFFSLPGEIMIYPSIYPIQDQFWKGENSPKSLPMPVDRGNFHSLREYLPGDGRRSIHWKTSAKKGLLMVQQHRQVSPGEILLILVAHSAPTGEQLISLVASLAIHFLQEKLQVGLHTGDGTASYFLAPESGKAQGHKILETLALLKLSDTMTAPFWEDSIFPNQDGYKMGFFSAKPPKTSAFDWIFQGEGVEEILNLQEPIFDPPFLLE